MLAKLLTVLEDVSDITVSYKLWTSSVKVGALFTIYCRHLVYNNIILARTPEIGQALGRILNSEARKPEQT